MPILKQSPTLSDFQKYVTELEHERDFNDQTTIDNYFDGRRGRRTI